MPDAKSVLAELKKKGSEKTRKIYARHGMPEDRTFGVSMADLKAVAKGSEDNRPWHMSSTRAA